MSAGANFFDGQVLFAGWRCEENKIHERRAANEARVQAKRNISVVLEQFCQTGSQNPNNPAVPVAARTITTGTNDAKFRHLSHPAQYSFTYTSRGTLVVTKHHLKSKKQKFWSGCLLQPQESSSFRGSRATARGSFVLWVSRNRKRLLLFMPPFHFELTCLLVPKFFLYTNRSALTMLIYCCDKVLTRGLELGQFSKERQKRCKK